MAEWPRPQGNRSGHPRHVALRLHARAVASSKRTLQRASSGRAIAQCTCLKRKISLQQLCAGQAREKPVWRCWGGFTAVPWTLRRALGTRPLQAVFAEASFLACTMVASTATAAPFQGERPFAMTFTSVVLAWTVGYTQPVRATRNTRLADWNLHVNRVNNRWLRVAAISLLLWGSHRSPLQGADAPQTPSLCARCRQGVLAIEDTHNTSMRGYEGETKKNGRKLKWGGGSAPINARRPKQRELCMLAASVGGDCEKGNPPRREGHKKRLQPCCIERPGTGEGLQLSGFSRTSTAKRARSLARLARSMLLCELATFAGASIASTHCLSRACQVPNAYRRLTC